MNRKLVVILMALASFTLCLTQCRKADQPSKTNEPKPASSTGSKTAVRFAPKGTAGLIHIEAKEVGAFLEAIAKEFGKGPDMADWFLPAAITDVTAKVQSVDIYFIPRPESGFTLIGVARTALTPEQLFEAVNKVVPKDGWELRPGGNGRYTVAKKGRPLKLRVIDGNVAKDINEPVLIFSPDDEEISLNQKAGVSEELSRLIEKVDTVAPVWVAFISPNSAASHPDDWEPTAVYGALYPLLAKESRVVTEFSNEERAKIFASGSEQGWQHFLNLCKVSQEGKTVVTSATMDEKFVFKWVEIQRNIRQLALQSLRDALKQAYRIQSRANLSSLARAFEFYQTEHGDVPPDMISLVKDGKCLARSLVNPASKHEVKTDERRIPTEPGDYIYIRPSAKSMKEPGTTILFYEPLEFNGGEGGNVVYLGEGIGHWLDATTLNAAIEHSLRLSKQE